MPEDSLRSRMFSQQGSVPQGMVPPNQDMNYGVEMKAQPSLVEKIAKTIFDFKNPSIDPSILESAPAGIVLNQRNAGYIKDVLKNFKTFVPDATKEDLAIAFMRVKNKLFSSLSPMVALSEAQDPSMAAVHGSYDMGDKITRLAIRDSTPIEKNVETLAHELTHAYQHKKDPIGLTTAYIPPDHKDVVDKAKQIQMYTDQYWERMARQGGATAKKAFEKFKDIIAEPTATRMDLQTPLNKAHVNDIMMPAVGKRMQQGFMQPEYEDMIKQNLSNALTKAAKTANGTLGPYEKPLTIEKMLGHFNTDIRQSIYDTIKSQGYTGFENPTFIKAPKELRSIQELILDK